MKIALNYTLLGAAITAGTLLVGASSAQAASIKATLTADNFYGLFYGNESGSELNFVARNESGDSGSPGRYNWSKAETNEFSVDADDYIYVVTWDDGRVAESWLGEFEIAGETVLTGADDWEYIVGGDNPYLNTADNALPGMGELQSLIAPAEWQDTVSIGKNGMNPWGTIDGIASDADWLQTASHTEGKYTIFRTKVAAESLVEAPEPMSLLGLLAVGVVGGGAVLKRKQTV